MAVASLRDRALATARVLRDRLFAFTPADLARRLGALGVRPGDIVFVHVAFDRFAGFTGKPTDVLACLRAAVGPAGTILMPSMPFTGGAIDYARSGVAFDARRTPSRMGIVTELFRRTPGTLRSAHPTHPTLANGPLAAELLRDHAQAETPCGAHSPFAKLAEHDARILLVGPGIGVLTHFHYIEELLEPAMPFSPFTTERFTIAFTGPEGEARTVTTRLYDPACSKRRRLGLLEAALRGSGRWREARVGRLRLTLLVAAEVEATAREMAARGEYCYE